MHFARFRHCRNATFKLSWRNRIKCIVFVYSNNRRTGKDATKPRALGLLWHSDYKIDCSRCLRSSKARLRARGLHGYPADEPKAKIRSVQDLSGRRGGARGFLWHGYGQRGMDCEYRGAGHVAFCDMDTDRGGWTVSIEGRGTYVACDMDTDRGGWTVRIEGRDTWHMTLTRTEGDGLWV